VINFDSPRGGISLVTEKGVLTTSRLLVQKAIQQDSGLYTCTPSNANPTSVRVHIVDGEHPAAMHHGDATPQVQPPPATFLLFLVFLAVLLLQEHPQASHKRKQQQNFQLRQRTRWKWWHNSQLSNVKCMDCQHNEPLTTKQTTEVVQCHLPDGEEQTRRCIQQKLLVQLWDTRRCWESKELTAAT
ncbi:uncharacterized protein LOC118752692, partial [Rhagoletis pomonella]|uniref:uncharacterized protein LOC118750954 n=1 Tax=Rhagoletis pomonella TaxID=28610 RepID=UPI00177C1127